MKTINLKMTGTSNRISVRNSRNTEVASCLWSGNEGHSAALGTITQQLRARFDRYTLWGRDQFGEMVVVEQWDADQSHADAVAAELEMLEHDQQMQAEWDAAHA